MFSNDQHTSGRNIVKDKLYDILLKKGHFILLIHRDMKYHITTIKN